MLYERWRQIARDRRHEVALRDLESHRQFTFAELTAAAEAGPVLADPVVFPQGGHAGFVLEVLRAWRHGRWVCPLEPGQSPPSLQALPSGCVHLKSTSASTGPSRSIAFRAEQLAADADQIVWTMGLRPDWPNLGVISLAHSYGFSNLVLPLLLHGIPLILLGSPLPEAVRHAAASAEALTLPAVPALWRAWHEARAIPANVSLAISAGSPLSAELEQTILTSSGLKVHNFYGSSECGGIAYDRTSVPRADPACVGMPMEGTALRIGDDGCLEVRSPAVGETYWPEPGERLGQGCFRTSDLAESKAGLIYLRGRLSDQLNVAGRKLAPEIIEQALQTHPAVRECLVFSVPSRGWDRTDTIVACVAARGAADAEVLRQHLLGQLHGWQVPKAWWFVDHLAADQRGKLSRAEWRQRYLALGLAAAAGGRGP